MTNTIETGNRLLDQAYNDAVRQAAKAQPFILKHSGKVYTAVFNNNHWVYDVYEDGVFMQSFNFKSATQCKAYLKQWLES